MVTNKHLELTPFEVDVLEAHADMQQALAAQADMLYAQQVLIDSLAAWLDRPNARPEDVEEELEWAEGVLGDAFIHVFNGGVDHE